MPQPLKVLFLSSEVAPFAKTGGLADISGSLPKALKALGIEIRVALPYYRMVKKGCFDIEILCENIETSIGSDRLRDDAYVTRMDGDIPVYLINKEEYFDRGSLYGTSKGDYFDNLERFVYFCKALFVVCQRLNYGPDIIHCNDWQTGLVPAYLQTLFRNTPPFSRSASLFTIHNIAYQGLFSQEKFDVTGLPRDLFSPKGIEFWGRINLLKSGIVFSHIINTVSRRYSQEIQAPEFGYGLDGVLRSRKRDLFGILNGVDYTEWNPKTDPLIAANYDVTDLRGKGRCKEDLLREFHLPERLKSKPVIGVISRLVSQKGFDLLGEIVDDLMGKELGLVILGTGDLEYERRFLEIARRYPEKVGVKITYDNTLAHKIEAGADMFLMPSRYEPCGLNQIYSLKYGTVPIVRATGGLDDTIEDYHANRRKGTGFKFKRYRARDLFRRIEDALSVYGNQEWWKGLQVQGMKADFSWDRSAKEYAILYKKALARARYRDREGDSKGLLPQT
jgi:starch synthase